MSHETFACAGADAYAYPLLIKQLLLNVRAQAGANEIVYCDKRRFSYPEFLERIARLGSALTGLGSKSGDVVAVMEWDTHRYLECFFAVPMTGAVLQTINIRLSVEQICYTLDHAGATTLLCNAEFAPLLAEVLPKLPRIHTIVLLTDDGVAPAEIVWSGEYEALLAAGDPAFVFPELDEHAPATTFYTSGTTGLPKAVFYSHRQIVLHTLAELATVALGDSFGRLTRDTVYMPITPMFHSHAWGLPYVATMAGCTQIYPGRYVPEKLIELYRTERVGYSHCVPTLLQMMLTDEAARDVDYSGWQVLVGGAAISSGLVKLAEERGVTIITGYGMSETGPMLNMTRIKSEAIGAPDDERFLRIKAGMPIALVDLRVVDAEMNDVPVDGESVGEIVARAPWLTQGYRGDPEASDTLWRGGYLHTQDVGIYDEHGYLRIVDRLKDVIKTGGEWVSSLQLEDLLSRHGAVREAAVIAVPDPKWSERPVALIVLKPDQREDDADLRTHLLKFVDCGTISKFAVPDRFLFIDDLARTSVGKIDKRALRARYIDA